MSEGATLTGGYAAEVVAALAEARRTGASDFAEAWASAMREVPAPWSWRPRPAFRGEAPLVFLERQCRRAWDGEAVARDLRALAGDYEDGAKRAVRAFLRLRCRGPRTTPSGARWWPKYGSEPVGSDPQTEVIMGEQQERKTAPSEAEQPKTGRLARWRERRRKSSARAADMSRRSWDADQRNVDNASKYGRL